MMADNSDSFFNFKMAKVMKACTFLSLFIFLSANCLSQDSATHLKSSPYKNLKRYGQWEFQKVEAKWYSGSELTEIGNEFKKGKHDILHLELIDSAKWGLIRNVNIQFNWQIDVGKIYELPNSKIEVQWDRMLVDEGGNNLTGEIQFISKDENGLVAVLNLDVVRTSMRSHKEYLTKAICQTIKISKIVIPVHTVATLIGQTAKPEFGSGLDIFEYKVNGMTYRYIGNGVTDVIGDKYDLMYDSLRPNVSKINFRKPVFLKDEQTSIAVGRISQYSGLSDSISDYYISISYTVNGKDYIKSLNNYEKITVARDYEFQVEYWVENPKRSIIHFDRPITHYIKDPKSK
jgi:hypothetical protein